ncbi:hypothetical protein LIER_15269 [Lithospermum erythrorhizon]|uniref:Uncharacterized protein n=1 Tax=Lithospermum erythrorhizon TaxID=34254 RepID=A0AAV3Q2A5_LITER
MNLAMLAKQGWRVATQEASLLFKLLKGKYFRRSSFSHAKLGANPSYGWRSLLEGRKVLEKGARWRIGDGRSINFWTEPWIPRKTNFHIRGARGLEPLFVSNFIRGEHGIK